MNEIGIVVSRYYEDLTWIHNIKSSVDVYVYNRVGESPGMGSFGVEGQKAVSWAKPKDPNDNLGGLDTAICQSNGVNLQIIEIPDDPGFEASTYTTHFYTRYDKLNDYTVCIQGHPEIYVKDVIDIFNNPDRIKYTEYYRTTDEDYSPASRRFVNQKIGFQPICEYFGTVYPESEYNWSLWKGDYINIPWIDFVKDIPGSVTEYIGQKQNWTPPKKWHFGAGNQFIVSKELVQKRDTEYYKNIHKFSNTYLDPRGDSRPSWQQLNQGPNVMEGIWQFIF